ncbi:MAG TPA: hypothetical protein DCW47_04950, partial [Lachnospiraceae bacterium]|nr:hypothetical protein [Lachnospiraceae bacterium]
MKIQKITEGDILILKVEGRVDAITGEDFSEELKDKLKRLEEHLKELGSLAVGFSAGVDSSFLLEVAHKVLGDRVIAVTGVDSSIPERELKEAKEFCKDRGIKHVLCTVDPMKNEEYRKNG